MSTRRARIKAVTALPPRRKNVDNTDSKKKQEESKELFEAVIKPAAGRRPSFDKTPKDRCLSIDNTAQEQTKDGFGVRVSPKKSAKEGFEDGAKTPRARRFSMDKSPKQHCLSVDKSPKTHLSSIITTPKQRLIVDKSSKRRFSTEVIVQDLWLPVNTTVQECAASIETASNLHTNLSDKATDHLSIKPDKVVFSSNKILKGLLDATGKPPNNPHILNSPVTKTTEIIPKHTVTPAKLSSEPSTCKEEGSQSDNDMGTKNPKVVPFFASPRGRASPRRPSPIVRTPVIEVDLIAEKFIAPHKGPNSVDSERNYIERHAADVNRKFRKPEVEVIIEKIINKDEFNKLEEILVTKKPKDSIKIIDEYVIQPLPETSTVMDGIVPLHSASKTPKPLNLLKNEIISENAEVLFDPIVPLPSPSKVRPKLRPVPRLGPRRNSFQQGSASESEDENRRLHGRPGTPATPGPARQRHDSHTAHAATIVQRDVARVRNDSVCSTTSQAPSQITAVGSPLREREKTHKTRREDMTARRNAAMRRRQVEVERDKLTMYDLIFYNPKANPIIPDQDEIQAKEANKKEEEERKEATKQASSREESSPEAAPASAVPQIKLGPNGEIILDEQSLVVNQSDQRKIGESVVREGAWGGAGSRAYRRTPRTADWSDAETVRFYRALAAMGTDFTLMQPLFPARSRRDLKLKFKKEERLNLAQVDMALRSRTEWDPARLETEFTEERRAAEEDARREKERLKMEKEEEKERERDMKNLRMRRSKCSKTLGDSAMPKRFGQSKTTPSTLDEYVKFQEERKRKAVQRRPRKRKQLEDFVPAVTSVKGVVVPTPSPVRSSSPSLATLTLLDRHNKLRQIAPKKPMTRHDMATITKEVPLPVMPPNIETGSLVVLTVNDPQSPSRKMLQTYIAQGPGNLTPVSLPANFLNSVVGFMKRSNSPIPTVVGSPVCLERSKTPNIISPRKRKSSYTITQL